MASTSLPSMKTTSTSSAPTSSKTNESLSSNAASSGVHGELPAPVSARNSLGGDDDDNDQASSGDEWGMEIGNLIIDLDADLQKDEMKEKGGNNEIRNTNNNNSIKGSTNNATSVSSSSIPQSPKLSTSNAMNTNSKPDAVNSGGKISKLGSGSNTSAPTFSGKKPKSKKSKSGNSKHGNSAPIPTGDYQTDKGQVPSAATTSGRTVKSDFVVGSAGFSHMPTSNVATGKGKYNENAPDVVKSGSKSSKTGRSYKKHGKNNNNNPDKKTDTNTPNLAAASANKDGKEKPPKAGKSNKHQSQSSVTNTVSVPNATHSMGAFMTTSGSLTSTKTKNNNAPYYPPPNTASKFSNHCPTMSTDAQVRATAPAIYMEEKESQLGKTALSRSNEAPIMSAVPHLGKHRKTSSMPSAMKYPAPFNMPVGVSSNNQALAPIANSTLTTSDLRPGQVSTASGKRERNSANVSLAALCNSKKIKLEKETKAYNSSGGMTPTDGENAAAKPNTATTAMSTAALSISGHYNTKLNENIISKTTDMKNDIKKTNSSTRTALSSVSVNLQSKNGKSETSSVSGTSAETICPNLPQNGVSSSTTKSSDAETSTRTIGTVTTYADVGVETEPEALGPCEPGTCVRLSGIVWHETESGILVVNVTWRNRSYVGTLLDATKHEWAPPRIPDADSDVEFRVKSGRPKRRGNGNGSGVDTGGRKGRKSAMANNGGDDYKCSPSSNKRRSNKMSESDACSGNDGEICTTPSKSAKRARMSRSATAKQATQKATSSATAKETISGYGTSGSGSSACSSPVFMECPYANCKKRYKDDNAFKYHEAHAHPGEEAEDAEKSGQDADSSTADSPKDSDNLSTKSGEELPASESSSSPPVTDNEPVPAQVKVGSANFQAMETSDSAQAPFVVTQSTPGPEQTTQFQTAVQPTPMDTNFVEIQPTKDPARTKEFTTPLNNSAPARDQSKPSDGVISPYTLTDTQINESISLKTHGQSSKTPRSYHTSRPTSSYAESGSSNEAVPLIESSSAVDSESAQAVKTLLQLQDSQDQLPGLTPYNQASQAPTLSMPQSSPMTSEAPIQSQPSQIPPVSATTPLSMPANIDSQNPTKMQQGQHGTAQPFRSHGHSKDGSPLPRMSVGISTPRNSGSVNGQYTTLGGYPTAPHGTITANTTQEGVAHYTPSGQRTVKGKTVPIPTDPQQAITPSSQAGSATTPPGAANSLKKQKRKKPPKIEAGKSPTDTVPKPMPAHPPSRPQYREEMQKPGQLAPVRIKQEQHQQQQAGPAGVPTSGYHKMQQDVNKHHMVPHPQRPSEIKLEPGSKVPTGAHHQPRPGAGFVHPNAPQGQRPQMHAHLEYPGQSQDHIAAQLQAGNKNNNNKLATSSRGQEIGTPSSVPHHVSHHQRVQSPNFQNAPDSRDPHRPSSDGRPRSHLNVPQGSSHSLPGSRSRTPVSQPPVHQQRPNPVSSREGVPATTSHPSYASAGIQQRRPSSKESGSPPPPLDRRLSMDELKQVPMSMHRAAEFAAPVMQQFINEGIYNQYSRYVPAAAGYDLARYQFMNDPQFQQHYENVIQQEMSKDQNAGENQTEQRVVTPSSRPRSTPSPNPQPRTARPKSPRVEERRSRGESPVRGQQYPAPHGMPIQPGRGPPHHHQQHMQPHHQPPRVSPVPHGSYPATPIKQPGPSLPPGSRGLSPHPQATASIAGARPPRPSSEAERFHRREHSLGERPTASRMSSMTPGRKIPSKEGYPEHRPQTPEKVKSGPPPTSVYASPGVPVQAIPPGARTPVQYYPTPAIFDPRSLQSYAAFPAAYAMFPHGTPLFPGHWPPGGPPAAVVPSGPEKTPSQSPHPGKPSRDRSSSGSRSPYRDESDRRSRGEVRGREGEPYPSSKERRSSDGPIQMRKSITPDPKSVPIRNPAGDGSSGTATPPTQRHHHTHHHIHEGIPLLPHQYPYPMASAVMAGSEAAAATLAPAALAPFPKRDLP